MERQDLLSKVAREGRGPLIGPSTKFPGPADGAGDEDHGDMNPCKDGPSRETALSMLTQAVTSQRRKLAGLEHLLKIAEKLENGSPAEEALWELLCRSHNRLFH